ncbi:hypothetical protein L6164_027579 [Bauhinia variegata]|uniref:Uncharacterized protein n=1 Tax=Bauhinia variegata TaxID=167791 RepID=A0ACB9LV61_BAUVA|nr:hypothetical protein L6164_027579 [Bauhinia variegata]
MSGPISEVEQEELLEKLEVFKIKGRDKHGRKILRIIGKFFPARLVSVDVLKKFLEERIFPKLGKKPFSVLYLHTGVQRSENFPGIAALRSIYEAIPVNVKGNLQAVYFIHPGLQARLFLATFGRFLFSAGLYGKLRYVSRLDYLWEHVRRNEVEIPDFVSDHDEDLEYRPMMDYGLESDHARVYGAPSPVSTYSMSLKRFPQWLRHCSETPEAYVRRTPETLAMRLSSERGSLNLRISNSILVALGLFGIRLLNPRFLLFLIPLKCWMMEIKRRKQLHVCQGSCSSSKEKRKRYGQRPVSSIDANFCLYF